MPSLVVFALVYFFPCFFVLGGRTWASWTIGLAIQVGTVCRCETIQSVATGTHFSSRAIFIDTQQFVSATTVSGDTDHYYSLWASTTFFRHSMCSACHDFDVLFHVWNSTVGIFFFLIYTLSILSGNPAVLVHTVLSSPETRNIYRCPGYIRCDSDRLGRNCPAF